MMENSRRIAVRDCQAFLWALYRQYEGEAHASFEGRISALELGGIPGASHSETSVLKPTDGLPFDFWVVPVNAETIEILGKKLSGSGVLGNGGSIIHTQLAVGTQPVFQAFDNFHAECSVLSRIYPLGLLEVMLGQGILRSIERFPA